MYFGKISVAAATLASYAVNAEPLLRTRDEDIAKNNTNPVAKSFIVEYTAVGEIPTCTTARPSELMRLYSGFK